MSEFQAGDDVAASAAEYASTVSLDSVPDAVRERLQIVLLDTVGVCIRGSQTPYIEAVAAGAGALGRGRVPEGGATVFATGDRRDVALAALVNAAGGTTLELDEGNQRSAHPGIHTVPPALATAEHVDSSGRELLEAILAGYEVGARLGDVIRPMRDGLHPHGGWAPVSAAVSVGRLLELDANRLADAIRNAVNPFIVGHWAAALDGATIRNFYTGLACQHGILAATFARSGVTGVRGAIEECLLPNTASRAVSDALLAPFETFGDEFYLTDSYVKVHAACRYAHAPIEALAAVQGDAEFDPDEVERIEVRTFDLGTMLDRTDPDNVLSSKFSTPFALSTRLYTGRSDAEAFTAERVANPDIRALADRVEVVADEEFEARASEGRWGAKVTVHLADGTAHSATVTDARGGGENPFSTGEIYEKFDALVGARLSRDATRRLRERILDVDGADNVETVLEPFADQV